MAHVRTKWKQKVPILTSYSPPKIVPAYDASPKDPADGRTVRSTGRTKQLATRVREEFYHELRLYAAIHRLKIVEVFERAFEALKKTEIDK
jgi:hypothetical protein